MASRQSTSRATSYRLKKKQMDMKKDMTPSLVVYNWSMIHKCYVDQEVLVANSTCTMKVSFHNVEHKEMVAMCLLLSMHAL